MNHDEFIAKCIAELVDSITLTTSTLWEELIARGVILRSDANAIRVSAVYYTFLLNFSILNPKILLVKSTKILRL